MQIQVTQFKRPNGSQHTMTTEVSDDCLRNYEIINENRLRLTAEVLSGNNVNICLEDKEFGDYISDIVRNGSEVPALLEKIIKEFDESKYQEWHDNERAMLAA